MGVDPPSESAPFPRDLSQTTPNQNSINGITLTPTQDRKRTDMARKRIELGAVAEDQIKALMTRGGTAQSISAALTAGGVTGASVATIGRRMQELRGDVNAARAARRVTASGGPVPGAGGASTWGPPSRVDTASKAPLGGAEAPRCPAPGPAVPVLPGDPGDIPENTPLAELTMLRAQCKDAIETASTDGDLQILGTLIRTQAHVEGLINRATPAKAPDPNSSPDMVKLGEEWEARMHKMIDLVCGT